MKNQMLKVSKLSNDGMLLRKERKTGNEHGEWENKNKTKNKTNKKSTGKKLYLNPNPISYFIAKCFFVPFVVFPGPRPTF